MTDLLKEVWEAQVRYNSAIRAEKPDETYEDWMEKYILGVQSELSEVLDELNWKIHRQGKPIHKINLGRELADVTKYVLSLWEVSGFDESDMLTLVDAKTEEMFTIWRQETATLVQGKKIIIADIDVTIADFRKG